jgi:hypothetical protein
MKTEWRVVAIFNVILFVILVSPAVESDNETYRTASFTLSTYSSPYSQYEYFHPCAYLLTFDLIHILSVLLGIVVRVLRRLLRAAEHRR